MKIHMSHETNEASGRGEEGIPCTGQHNNYYDGPSLSKGRFDVSKLHGRSIGDKGVMTSRVEFQKQVCERTKELWNSEV